MGTLLARAANPGMPYDDPKDWTAWEQYRGQVRHPCTRFQPEDLARAQANIRQHAWAKAWADGQRRSADAILPLLTPEYLATMAESTTPGAMGPCPACRDQGKRWHPNGQWSWSAKTPNEMTCAVCKTVFPNPTYPETVELRSTWDPRQVFRFYGGDTFRCFGYTHARPTFTGIIRGYKLNHLTSQLRSLALAYAVSAEARYAQGARLILLRLAEVLPKYLVRAGYGYGEFADCDPHTASERIDRLPNDELVYPPNRPDRRLYTGYWSASRIGSSGMDGGWVTEVTVAYDLTCEARTGDTAVYSDADRRRIERDLLLEGSYLAACDPSINNKSVGNRAGAAMVGLCVGHPGLVRFGIDGFLKTVDGWFLPDGGTSESAAYAMMTMSGIRPFGEALRDYSEPAGYCGPDGRRLEHFNACRDTRYGTCWQDLLWTLQGDLHHAPLADSYRSTGVDAAFAELIAVAYPTPEHRAYLAEVAGDAPKGSAAGLAAFYRDPGLTMDAKAAFDLPDVAFPFLAQGYLRLGDGGRRGLVVLNASDWGGHHHEDSLDLYLWKDGHELLSDLGYLWDHPDKPMTYRTAAHNLVLIGGKGQATKGRGGSIHLFGTTPIAKFVEASSSAYPGAEVYQRTCIQVEPAPGAAYVVDVFRAARGAERRDYLFHGPTPAFEARGLDLQPAANAAPEPVRFAVRFHLDRLARLTVRGVTLCELRNDGSAGPNLARPVPAAPFAAEATTVDGWGRYVGDGRASWGLEPETPDALCLVATGADKNGRVNVALLLGESDGYQGPRAFSGMPGTRYRLRYSLKAGADVTTPSLITWPGDPTNPGVRAYEPLEARPQSPEAPTAVWREYEAGFAIPAESANLGENPRSANSAGGWSLRWRVAEDYGFTALVPGGGPAEQVTVRDGWGQRDHRNSDRGATLPYVFRTRPGVGSPAAFVTVFEGAPAGSGSVQTAVLLPTKGETAADAVALAVSTNLGVDLVVSQRTTQAVTFEWDGKRIETDARLAVVHFPADAGARPVATMVEGTRLRTPQVALDSAQACFTGEVAACEEANGTSWFEVKPGLSEPGPVTGPTLFVKGEDGIERAYPVRRREQTDAGTRLYTEWEHQGFPARPARTWRLSVVTTTGYCLAPLRGGTGHAGKPLPSPSRRDARP